MHKHSDSEQSSSDDFVSGEDSPHLITESELNALTSDLQLSKSKVSIYPSRSEAYADFFTKQNEFGYCHDAKELFEEM